MANLNEVRLIGNLGQDPEVRYTAGGNLVVNMSIATTEKWRDKVTGEKKSHTEWHQLTAWAHHAEYASKVFGKGDSIFVTGKIRSSKYERNGVVYHNKFINVTNIQLLKSKKASS